jgi:hypothetical protein
MLLGCTKEETSNVIKLTSNDDLISINYSDIIDNTYFDYVIDGIDIGLFGIRDSNNDIKLVINTCQSCTGSPNAYFIKYDDTYIQCQNCGNLFKIDDLGNLVDDGCNPIGIDSIKYLDDKLEFDLSEIISYKDNFTNWNGPKL